MQQSEDILGSFEIQNGKIVDMYPDIQKTPADEDINILFLDDSENNKDFHTITGELEDNSIPELITKKTLKRKVLDTSLFLFKYSTTSLCIFGVLMVASNYSAYFKLAQSIIFAEELEQTKQSLIESVAASGIQEDTQKSEENNDTFRGLRKDDTKKITPDIHDISQLSIDSKTNIDLGIEITPYENRIIIPKIGKNIPLLDIKQKKVEGVKELNDIFMDELENGVIRYPGSAKPGENGNSFIFGHSSNFPWMEGDYNDVFALLDKVVFDDEVIIYYGQEKYTYKIRTKNVISPGDVSVLKSEEKDDRSQITLMTCWPIGTTLNRLVLTGELIHIEK